MNNAEQLVRRKLQKAGYSVFRNGWPDFFAVRGRDYLVIEVKGSKHKGRTREQRIAHAFLKALGIHVHVLRSFEDLPKPKILMTLLEPVPIRGKNGRPRTYHIDRPASEAERTRRHRSK